MRLPGSERGHPMRGTTTAQLPSPRPSRPGTPLSPLQRPSNGTRGTPRVLVALLIALLLAAAVAAAACGGDAGDEASTVDFSARAVAEDFDPEAQPVLLNSALGVGHNRLAFGFFRSDASLILDGSGTVRLYRLDENRRGTPVAQHQLQRAALSHAMEAGQEGGSQHSHEEELVAVFYASVELDRAGDWAAAFDLVIEGEARRIRAQPFSVLNRTPEPQIGDPLPASPHLTLSHTDDISLVSTMTEPISEMNELTVSEAVATGRPILVALATPAYCQSRFCGPLMDAVVVPLWEEFGSDVQFVHIEPFIVEAARTAGQLVPIPLMRDWQLQTEPWLFVARSGGTITAKFEGVASLDEVREALLAAIDAG